MKPNSITFFKSPNSSGIFPLIKLSLKSIFMRDFKPPILEGKVPYNLVELRSRISRFSKLPIEVGIWPQNWFRLTTSFFSLYNLPSSSGNGPFMLFSFTTRFSKFPSSHSSDGSSPTRASLLRNVRLWIELLRFFHPRERHYLWSPIEAHVEWEGFQVPHAEKCKMNAGGLAAFQRVI